MSCWVVPTVAAELWGCSLDAVLAQIRHGQVATKEEGGWTFIDIAPDSPRMQSVQERRAAELAAVVNTEESQALVAVESDDSPPDVLGDWKKARQQAEEARRAPIRIAA